MKNFESYIDEFTPILKAHIDINNVPEYLFAELRNKTVNELKAFLIEDYKDISPKKLTEFQKVELKYMLERRKLETIHYNGTWRAGDIILAEDYSNFNQSQEYSISKLLMMNEIALVFADTFHMYRKSLDFGYLPNHNTNIEFQFKGITDIAQIMGKAFYGVRTPDSKNRFVFMISNTGNILIDIGTKRTTISTFDITKFLNSVVTVKLIDKRLSIQINDEAPVDLGEVTFTEFVSTLTLIFGGVKTGEIIGAWVQLDLNYLKVYDINNTHLIKPVYNDLGDVIPWDTIAGGEVICQ